MHRTLRTLAALVAALLVALLATACQGGHDGKGVTITYWANPMTAEPEQHHKELEKVLTAFTEETGIKVDVEMQDWTKVYPKIISAIASRSLPDVFDTGTTWAAALQATGGLMPFDDDAFKAIGGRSRFVASSMASTGAPGKPPAAVPLYGMAYGLYYNPTMFAAAGISRPPRTWADLVSDARRLTTKDHWGIAVGGTGALNLVHHAFVMGRQNGGHLFSPSGEPTFDTPAERAAVRRLLDLMDVDKVIDPSMIEQDGIGAVTAFGQGKAAMVIAQTASVTTLHSLGFDDYKVAQVPVLDPLPTGGAPVQSIVAGTNLAVSADTPHRAAALQLVKYLTSDRAQTMLSAAFGTLPVTKSVQASAEFSDPVRKVFGQILAHHSEPMPQVPDEGAMEIVLGEELVKLWPHAADGSLTDAEVEQALRRAEQKMPQR